MRYVICILLVAGPLGCGDGGKEASVDGRKVTGNEFKGELARRLVVSQPTASQSVKRGEMIVKEKGLRLMGSIDISIPVTYAHFRP